MTDKDLSRIKSGRLERRLAVSLAGVRAGSAIIAGRATDWWLPDARKQARRSAVLAKQARLFAEELGRLKGSYVKIGQMLALFGEHLLPVELTSALHTLEDRTATVNWSVLQPVVDETLGGAAECLDIDPRPIGAASLGQVHRATEIATGRQLCLKIQYPGIRDSIDADFDDVVALLKLAQWLPAGQDLGAWLEEIRHLLHLEVDYRHEARMTRAFAALVARDRRFRVPAIMDTYSGDSVLTMDYMRGHAVTDPSVQELPQTRRNALGKAMLDLLLREIFDWGVMQTDPNFGNYRIANDDGSDYIVLLDFGAARKLDPTFLGPLQVTIAAAYRDDLEEVIRGLEDLRCIQPDHPAEIKESFARFCMSLLEPLRRPDADTPPQALNSRGEYRWRESNLLKRAGKLAARSAFSTHFTPPPKEFALITRKLTGTFTFIAVLGAEFCGHDILERHLHQWQSRPPGRRRSKK